MKRRDLLLGGAWAALLPAPLRASSPAEAAHLPQARTVDVVDRRYGLTLPDPYRWMEDSKDADWVPFMRRQAAHARAKLDSLPGRAQIARRVAELSGEAPVAYRLEGAAGRTFAEYRPAGANSFKLYALDGPDQSRRLLYDPEPERDATGGHYSLDQWQVSPDGEYVALGVSPNGSEDSVIRVLRTRDGVFLPEKLDRAQYARLAWLPDSSGFFLSRLRRGAIRGAADYLENSIVWLHRLGTDPERDVRIAGGGDTIDGYAIGASEFPAIITDPNSGWALLQVSGAVRRHNPVFAAKLDQRGVPGPWRSVLRLDDEVTNVALAGDHLYAVSERGSPNGRILRTDLTAAGSAGEVIAPESEFPIEPTGHGRLMTAARDGIYFVRTQGGPQVIHRLGRDGGLTALPMPFEAGVQELSSNTAEDGVHARLSGWVQPSGLWSYRPAERRFVANPLNARPKFPIDRLQTFQFMARARDGARVPVSVVAHRGLRRDGSAPCLVRCYSAYGMSAIPQFNPRLLPLLERGGVFAQVHARGGGEFGSRWWRAGQKETKPNTWRDLVDACLALGREGVTSPSRTTILGGSAGGIAVGRALTERPDLFAGAILSAAFTNPSRIEAEPSGKAQYDEFGDPGSEAGFRALHRMDSYQHVEDGRAYPAVLVIHGMTDPRVAPWHAAKFAARLQKASSSGKPVLLRVTFDAGHGPGATREQTDAQWTDMIAFVLNAARAAGASSTER